MPTVLDAAGVQQVNGMDGQSFLPVLLGKEQDGRDSCYTCMNETAGRKQYPIRAVQTRRFGYIFNGWSDGKTIFVSESTGTPSFKAMQKAGEQDSKIAARVRLLDYRVPEELYDYSADPCALNNLIANPNFKDQRTQLRQEMLRYMERSNDPLLEAFRRQLAKAE